MNDRRPLARLGQITRKDVAQAPRAVITNTPPLPPVDFGKLGQPAPGLPPTPDSLPAVDVVVLCWADAEWAPLHHVFVEPSKPMPYSDAGNGTWAGWKQYAKGVPASTSRDGPKYWGDYRLVTVNQTRVLLFKSNVHLDEQPPPYIEPLVDLLVTACRPQCIISTGTAGGARVHDPIGTVNVVDAGTLLQSKTPWPTYGNPWRPPMTLATSNAFVGELLAVPTTAADLKSLVTQFNEAHGTSYTLADLDPEGLCKGASRPAINDLTPDVSLLTATSFAVGNTSGNFGSYACVEMDDAVVGEACKARNVRFGFVRNISDPVQNAALPSAPGGGIQAAWGSLIYDAYGFYTSFNGALATWAIVAAMGASHAKHPGHTHRG